MNYENIEELQITKKSVQKIMKEIDKEIFLLQNEMKEINKHITFLETVNKKEELTKWLNKLNTRKNEIKIFSDEKIRTQDKIFAIEKIFIDLERGKKSWIQF